MRREHELLRDIYFLIQHFVSSLRLQNDRPSGTKVRIGNWGSFGLFGFFVFFFVFGLKFIVDVRVNVVC